VAADRFGGLIVQVLNPSTGTVERDVPVTAFDPVMDRWDDAGYEPGEPHGERVPIEDLAAELGRAPDELAASIMAQRRGLVSQDFGGGLWVPARLLFHVRKLNRDRLAALAIPADIDRETEDVAEATQDGSTRGAGNAAAA
jgi:hypothetical protein